jgi:hypothetical protein
MAAVSIPQEQGGALPSRNSHMMLNYSTRIHGRLAINEAGQAAMSMRLEFEEGRT